MIVWERVLCLVAFTSLAGAHDASAQEAGNDGSDDWIVSGHLFLCEACGTPTAGLKRLYPVLIAESDAYGLPVVLTVGDTHVFRVDKPLYRADRSLVENFTRVEVFGDPEVHWVRVTVDLREREVFSFHQELVPTNMTHRQGSR